MPIDAARMADTARVGAGLAVHEPILWRASWSVAKYRGDSVDPADLYDLIEGAGNLAMYGGVSCLWEALIGNGTATAGQNLTYFSNAQSALGVGDSTTAEAATQTDLQASSNKVRVGVDATYPQHTDSTTSGAATITFRSTFGTSQANWHWQEWGTFNSATAATGRMLNRRVVDLGTKTSASTWQLSVSLTVS